MLTQPAVMHANMANTGYLKLNKKDLVTVIQEETANKLTQSKADNLYLGKTDKAVSAGSADTSTKATRDASGNVITSTYATKAEVVRSINNTRPDGNGNITPDQTGCLPLTGGKISGVIRTSHSIGDPFIYHENSNREIGGGIYLFDRNDTTYLGGFILRATTASGIIGGDLQGFSNGRLIWRGSDVATAKSSIQTPGYLKLSVGDDSRALALIWGEFSNAGPSGVTINLPISIVTLVSGWVNPDTSGGASMHMYVSQINNSQIRVVAGKDDEMGRSGNWGIIAHVAF